MNYSKLSNGWSEDYIIDLAPLSTERVTEFNGEKPYLNTGNLEGTTINITQNVTYHTRPSRADLVVRQGDVIAARMQGTNKVLEIPANCDELIVSTGFAVFRPSPAIVPSYLQYYLRSNSFQFVKDKYAQGSTQKAINNADLATIRLPIPPIPVQERIAQVLLKADDIRRQQADCSALVMELASSVFDNFMSDPRTRDNSVSRTIGSVLMEEPANGKSPSRKHAHTSAEVLTLSAIRNGRLNPEERKLADFEVKDVSRYYVKKNNCYVVRGNGNIGLLGRMGFHDGDDLRVVYPDTMIRLLFDNRIVINEFIQFLWDTRIIRNQILRKAKTSNGTHKINQDDIKSIEFPCPTIGMQQKFLMTAQAYFQSLNRQSEASDTADAVFSSLLARAFTGELTAEWETANADWIAEQTAIYSRLPHLAILSLMARRSPEASSITDLMDYLFLIQMEGSSRTRLYTFVASPSGPSTKSAISDLQDLSEQGLVRLEQTADEGTKATIADPTRVDQILEDLPEDVLLDIETTLDSYGDLASDSLLGVISEKYPAYVRRSRV